MASGGSDKSDIIDTTFELTDREKDTIDKAFSRLDRNGDGRISRDELKAGLIFLGENPTRARLAELFGAMDVNSNGYIEQEEFKILMAERFMEERLKRAYTKAAFKMLDKDGDGLITSQEITQVVADIGFGISPSGIKDLIRAADKNNDGKINYKEFSKALWRKASEGQLKP